MTGWYDPAQLLQTGIRVAAATVFGERIDRRELMAELDPYDKKNFQHFNFSGRKHQDPQGGFWLDYCADTGDGWKPTYAVARLLARKNLEIDTSLRVAGDEPVPELQTLPQARVLVFGGDQVYPTASRDAYREKLQNPYLAEQAGDRKRATPRSYLFAIPGLLGSGDRELQRLLATAYRYEGRSPGLSDRARRCVLRRQSGSLSSLVRRPNSYQKVRDVKRLEGFCRDDAAARDNLSVARARHLSRRYERAARTRSLVPARPNSYKNSILSAHRLAV